MNLAALKTVLIDGDGVILSWPPPSEGPEGNPAK